MLFERWRQLMESRLAKAGAALASLSVLVVAIRGGFWAIRVAGDVDFLVSQRDMLTDILLAPWLPIAGVIIGFVSLSVALTREKSESDEGFPTGIPQIKPTFLEIAPSGIPSNIIPHSKGVKCGLIRSNSPFSYSNHRPAKPKIPKPLVYAQVSPWEPLLPTP